jgi:hypothetical protein
LYAGEAVDEAVKAFARFADFELSDDADAWIVGISPKSEKHAARIVGEFSNFALGKTIERGRA